MSHKPWTEHDLINARIKRSYDCYKLCKTLSSVLTQIEESKPTFYYLTFLQKGDNAMAIYTRRVWENGCYQHKVVKELTFNSKEEENTFYLKIKGSKKVAKNNTNYYRA